MFSFSSSLFVGAGVLPVQIIFLRLLNYSFTKNVAITSIKQYIMQR